MRNKLFFLLMCGFSVTLLGQQRVPDSLALLFRNQLEIFPQEKIYLHTDKPYYVAGEKIWFRAYLADAITHIPSPVSRYVYVELINPLDSVVTRVKIRETEEAYHGYLPIPDKTSQGDYTLRAYTAFMQNQDENYFFTKTIHIGSLRTVVTPTDTPSLSGSTSEVDFDLSFYPEGGALLLGTTCKVAFKAMNANGQATEVSGVVYNQDGVEISTFQSDHLGMGSFSFLAQSGARYVAVCANDLGHTQSFDLPVAVEQGYALSVNFARDNLYISVQCPAESTQRETLYLFAHTRGMVHLINQWDHEKNLEIIPKNWFPSGVLHLVLFDTGLHPVSERLVFINNDDQAEVNYLCNSDSFVKRSLVQNTVTVVDSEGQPVTGSFSVSVTSDREVVPDATSNILTHLLLSSDLRGHIENPAYYFQNTPQSIWALDLLMCTQGWRRYHTEAWAQGRFVRPVVPIELDAEIRGTVKNSSSGKPVEQVEVIGASFRGGFFKSALTDREGCFHLPVGDLPDSTLLTVSVGTKRGATRMELTLDDELFPKKTLPAVPFVVTERDQFVKYESKARQSYSYADNDNATQLEASEITAERPVLRTSHYYSKPDVSITWEEIEKIQPKYIYDVLQHMNGVKVYPDGAVFIRRPRTYMRPDIPLVLVNDVPMDMSGGYEQIGNDIYKSTILQAINVHDIAQIDILKDVTKTNMFGTRGEKGVIAIFLKDGREVRKDHNGEVAPLSSSNHHIKSIIPLGYQQSAEFYVPKYETEAQRDNPKFDLRTTIHWQPVVQTDSQGKASFEFYTADDPTSYTVMIEGLAHDGTVIQKEQRLWQKEEPW